MDKNFNLDNLEKKNIYPVPDDFFIQMQQNVFAKIEQPAPKAEKEMPTLHKKSQTRWYYAAAATLAVLVSGVWAFGLKENPASTNSVAVQQKTVSAPATTPAENLATNTQQDGYVTDYYELLEAVPDMETATPRAEKVQFAKNEPVRRYAEASLPTKTASPAEEIMADLPIEEVRTLVDQSTPDVYLNLYQ